MADEPKPSGLLPFVRHMLVCEHAEPARNNPRRANVFGIFANVIVKAGTDAFPLGLGLTVYAMISDCRRNVTARLLVTEAETEEVCYTGVPYKVSLSSDPLEVHGLIFRIAECVIPREGLYWIELEFDGVPIAEEPILVKVR
jgi:hypothetical protein